MKFLIIFKFLAIIFYFLNPNIVYSQTNFGVYIGWVGDWNGNRLQKGAKAAGFKTIRIPLTPSFEKDFNISKKCYPDISLI